jgi:pyridoxamine 5'-phosphate oxidase family protein
MLRASRTRCRWDTATTRATRSPSAVTPRQVEKCRDLHDNPHVAFVVDDLVSVDPWRPRGVEIRGRAALHGAGGEQIGPGFGAAWLEIRPDRIVSWGIDSEPFGPPNARSVS